MTTWRLGSSPSERVTTPSISLMASWTALRSAGLIASSAFSWPEADDLLGDLDAEALEGGRAALPVAGDVDEDAVGARGALALDDGPGEVLDGGEGGASGAHEHAEVLAVGRDLDGLLVEEAALDRGLHPVFGE